MQFPLADANRQGLETEVLQWYILIKPPHKLMSSALLFTICGWTEVCMQYTRDAKPTIKAIPFKWVYEPQETRWSTTDALKTNDYPKQN